MKTCSGNNDNSEDSKGVDTFNHSGENNYANNGNDSVIQNGLFNVKHNSELNGFEQDAF